MIIVLNRIWYTLLTVIILFMVIVLFLLNSPKSIAWVADRYAPQYDFSYKQISGTLLTGLEIETLAFKNNTLVDTLKLGWNPASILYNEVSITHLEVNGLNVDNIKKVVKSFTSTDSNKIENGSFVLPVSIGVEEFKLTVKPFDDIGIGFKEISLDGEGILYYGEGANIDDLSLTIYTNVTKIQLSGEIDEKNIRIKKLNVVDVDTIAFKDVIEKMIAIKIDDAIIETVEPEVEEYKAGRENFIPKSVRVDSAVLTLKPAKHPQIALNRGEVNISSVEVDVYGMVDLHPNTLQVGELSVVLDSNLSKISMNSSLQNETVTVQSLSLRDIDTLALMTFLQSRENNETRTITPQAAEEKKTASMLLPKYLYIKHMDSSIKSMSYSPLLISNTELNASNMKLNIGTFTAESGEIKLRTVSNFASIEHHGVINDNHIKGTGHITPFKALIESYDLPLKEDAFSTIPFTTYANEKHVMMNMDIRGKEVLEVEEGAFNISELFVSNKLLYLIPDAELTVTNEGNISTSFTKEMHIKNVLTFKEGVLDYHGKVESGQIEGLDTNISRLLNGLNITYHGDTKSVKAVIDSEAVKGKFVSDNFKKGEITLKTKEALSLKNIFSLPEQLNKAKAALDMHVPLDFSNVTPLTANVKVTSNLAEINADVVYDNGLKLTTTSVFPQDSLLRDFSKDLNLDALSPLHADLTIKEKSVQLDVRSNGLISKVDFDPATKDIEGDLLLGGANFIFDGNVEKKVSLTNTTESLQSLLKQLSTIYKFEAPPLDGDIKLAVVLTDMKELELNLNSNTLMYKADVKTEHILSNTMISLGFADAALTLNKYHTTFQEQKIFATKTSLVNFKDGSVDISPLWINDELKVTGRYDIENKKGEILAYADPFNVSHEMTDLVSRLDIKSSMEGNKTSIMGTITILGGNIYYDMDKKTFASDKDIIIVHEMEKDKPTPFMDNLIASIKINTENPLLYKTDVADIKVKADLLVKKETKGPLSIFGKIEVLKGSFHSVENKKFVFKKSTIEFTGDPKEPILNMSAVYNSVKAEINIQIAGSIVAPDIVLSSIPYMSKDEIISSILFDAADEDSGDYSKEEKLKMIDANIVQSVFSNAGGGVVNTVFSTLGINIDALPFIGKSNDINKTKKAFFTFFSKEDKSDIPSHEIKFSGQDHAKESDLQKAMAVETKSIFQFWKEDRPKIKDSLLPTLEESLQNYYISEGFYDAKFSIKTSKTNVSVKIDENRPIKIHDIQISSDHGITDLITFKKSDIFKAKEFTTMKRNITQRLLNDGYCSYAFDSKAYIDTNKYEANIKVTLKKGDVCTFGKVTVKGLKTIDDTVVLSRVRAREGERFSIERIRESYDELYGLGAFDAVSVKYDKKFNNVVPIEIEGTEISKPWYFKGGLSFDTETGFRLSADAARTNFMGNAKQVDLHLAYSSIEHSVEVRYFVPAEFYFLGYYMDITSKVGYSEFKFTGFKENKSYAEATLDYNDEKLTLKAGLALENIDISPLSQNSVTHPLSSGNFLLTGPFLEFTYDTRDSKLDPKYGYYVAGKVEYALPYNNGASSYLKYDIEGRAIYTLNDLTLAAVGKAGSVDQLQNGIPESKFYFAGGVNSNRAYGYKRVGVVQSSTSYGVLGGETMANLTLEANYPIWEKLYGAVFTDNTILTKESYDFTGDVLSSAGLGVRYVTPIGPFKIDVGMNVDDPSQYAIWFQLGQSF